MKKKSLYGKTLVITGASRGIGEAIALKAASDGANIAILAKTESPHPLLPGTIYTAKEAVEKAGGKALAIPVDIRDDEKVEAAIELVAKTFGGIDILVNNASAIFLSDITQTPMKRYDLMQDVNARGTFLCSKLCIPFLKKSANPHILTLCPPLSFDPKWFSGHIAYTLSKFGMSLIVNGLADELKNDGIAVNALWPKALISTAALQAIFSNKQTLEEILKKTRKPAIVADAAWAILTRDAKNCSGKFFTDEEVLSQEGKTDLSCYNVDPSGVLQTDLFID